MVHCEIIEMCSNCLHCDFVKTSPVIVDNLSSICPLCIKSYLLLFSDVRSEISQLKAHILKLEKSCFCKSQPVVSCLSVFSTPSSSFLPIVSTNLTTLLLSLSNNVNHFLSYPSHFIIPLIPCPFPLYTASNTLYFLILLFILLPYPHSLPALHHSHLFILMFLLLLPLLLLVLSLLLLI